jgi:hypothetical protein
MKYRFGGKEKLLSFGPFPQKTLADARQDREQAKILNAQGLDPLEEKKEQEAARKKEKETFEAIALEWHGRYKSQWAPRTAEAILAMLTRDVFDEIGNLPIAAINAPILLTVQSDGRSSFLIIPNA